MVTAPAGAPVSVTVAAASAEATVPATPTVARDGSGPGPAQERALMVCLPLATTPSSVPTGGFPTDRETRCDESEFSYLQWQMIMHVKCIPQPGDRQFCK